MLERRRHEGEIDKLLWFCENCGVPLHEAGFPLKDIGTLIKEAIGEYKENLAARTCKKCGTVMEM